MSWPLWFVLVPCTLAVAAVGLAGFGARRWHAETAALTRALTDARTGDRGQAPVRYDPRELIGLPEPVQRYFRAVLTEGQPMIDAVTIAMTGTINLSATAEQWKSFTARQRIATHRPGFIWDASVSLLPGIDVHVYDSYIAGKGQLRAAVLGLYTVASLQGDDEIARGELMRYFAETAWYPTSLLPSQGVRWQPVDEHSAMATIVDGTLTLALLFRFNAAGLIESAHAEARGNMVDGQMVMAPWEGSWSDYQLRDGMTIPMSGEATWLRPEGRRTYFHGSVSSLSYEYAGSARPQ